MAKIIEIKKYDVGNGPGVRTSIWFRGCPHKCKGCFNEETWSAEGSGKEVNQELIKEIKNSLVDSSFHKDLSILGGEPLVNYNIETTLEICKQVKEFKPDTKIWIWSGYTFEILNKINSNTFKELTKYIDVLVDGKFEIENKDLNLKYRGSANQRVIDIKKTLKENKIVLFEN